MESLAAAALFTPIGRQRMQQDAACLESTGALRRADRSTGAPRRFE
ncbi:MAG: hypothetical protein U1F67_09495 [Rubrivivax sp.]